VLDVRVSSRNVLFPGERSISLWVLRGNELSRRDEVGTCVEETSHGHARLVAVHYGAMKHAFISSIAGSLHI
jgi:hypothetical protein